MNITTLVWISFSVTYLFVGTLIILIPLLTQSSVFGVIDPESNRLHSSVRLLKRSFIIQSIIAIAVGAAAGALTGWLTGGSIQVTFPVALIAQLVGLIVVISRHYKAAARMKKNQEWEQPTEIRRVANLKFRDQQFTLHDGWYLIPLGIIIASAVFAALMWSHIPTTLITHYDGNFKPDRYSNKSFGSVFTMNIIQVFMLVMFMGTNFVIRIAKQELDPNRAAESMEKQRQYRFITSVFIYGLSLFIILLFSYIQGTIIYNWSMDVFKVVLVLLPATIIGSIIALVVFLHRKGITQYSQGVISEEKHWRGGGNFYYNPEDPSLFVSKRVGMGWTINLGRPGGWLILGATLLIPISLVIITALLDSH